MNELVFVSALLLVPLVKTKLNIILAHWSALARIQFKDLSCLETMEIYALGDKSCYLKPVQASVGCLVFGPQILILVPLFVTCVKFVCPYMYFPPNLYHHQRVEAG